jgi:hypothetical protein
MSTANFKSTKIRESKGGAYEDSAIPSPKRKKKASNGAGTVERRGAW